MNRAHSLSTQSVRMLVLIAVAAAVTGCASNARTYSDHTAEEIWVAMTAVAETPDYDGQWHVTDNKVAADLEAGRIDIQRTLRRTVYQPDSEPRPERRDWNFTVTLEQRDPPVVTFEPHGWAIPAYKQFEIDRFFLDLERLLNVGDAIEVSTDETETQTPEAQPGDNPTQPLEPDEPADPGNAGDNGIAQNADHHASSAAHGVIV